MNIYSEINNNLALALQLEDSLNINTPIIIEKNNFRTNFAIGVQKCIYTSGLCILIQNFTVLNNFISSFTIEKNYIQLSILLNGKVLIMPPQNNSINEIKPGFLLLTYQNKNTTKIKVNNFEKKMSYIKILISKPYLLSVLKNEKWFPECFLYEKILKNSYINFGEIILPVNYNILTIISEIIKIKEIGIFGHSYYHIKIKELFLKVFMNLSSNHNNIHFIKDEDFKKIQIAKAYLNTHYKEPPTIKQLSKIIYLNELKLKTGFKLIYKCTIHYYVTELRMKYALQMMHNKYPINEIAIAVGYKSSSHFIASFKKLFGKTPKQYIMDKQP